MFTTTSARGRGWVLETGGRLLADQENIDGAEIEVVKERKGSKTIVSRMLAGIKLHTPGMLARN